jgi:hypothetical protein
MITSPNLVALVLVLSLQSTNDSRQQHCWNEMNVDSIIVSVTPISDFRALTAGLTRESIISKVGKPSFGCGSGIPYDVYRLSDGREVWIAYVSGSAAWAKIVNNSAGTEETIFGA